MFTGLIEETGVMKRIGRQGEAMLLTIGASKVLEGVQDGDSISVNGVCLTVVSFDRASFTVDVMPQTYRHSNLSEVKLGQRVNLERAMAAGGRFGGHIVQGHVDGTGVIVSRTADANAVVYRIKPSEEERMRYIIPQGSVTIDGISLTVFDVHNETFAVSIIPHTLRETALQDKKAGDTINIECDILGKYVDHLLHYGSRSGESAVPSGSAGKGGNSLSAAFLADNGFM
ncbi:riboflavin synthase [Paenibacillus beijingensis]|uniref:Riboflavin synthase n=1 Tax=Paenibacillus beijingensis TaxID=1126833 RepID=A0A0D5NQG2_9BACL|nr:riboflavin synthase [Paenibacillus beijingensis]AJY77217.1 riboflavin synthase subunit alpha [Paenibacillus beijingensis]